MAEQVFRSKPRGIARAPVSMSMRSPDILAARPHCTEPDRSQFDASNASDTATAVAATPKTTRKVREWMGGGSDVFM